MDGTGDGRGAVTAAGLLCGSCGTELPPDSRFCNKCGAPVRPAPTAAEYKQVTVLFADVVHSMGIAAAVGAERLREIMAELANQCAAVVRRFDGTVNQFTGDGIMAVFGAPTALEDHAVRACLAGLAIQEEANQLAVDVHDRDGVELRLRVGLNSGQVIAGEIGSGPFGYTTIGEQVGMAQRMESVAPPGGVMLSASTASLVEGTAALGERQLVHIKGSGVPVPAHRLLGMAEHREPVRRAESNLVGRRSEMSVVEGLLDSAVDGHGVVVGVVGRPGIGKSRLVREVAAIARQRGVEVFTAVCESHASQVPFRAVARLLRDATGVEGLGAQAARDRLRDRMIDADPEDMLLLDDLLGIGDPAAALPQIDPDARRRRLTALVNAASLARETPAVYVVEDAHWIDEVSESMLADFFTVIPQTPSLVLVTYRPEYGGGLTRVHGTQTITLAPLTDSETAGLVSQLLGPNPSMSRLGQTIAERAAGNPFFAEEIVRELAQRGVLRGQPGAYLSTAEFAEVIVPATVQATIAARIDRLDPRAKRTLSAAAVIGSQFDGELLSSLLNNATLTELIKAELIDEMAGTDYAFRHPLIQAVAYESQLKSARAELHRRLATAIEQRDTESADANAGLIATHLMAAGDLSAAFDWHMRAGTWLKNRDITAARISWRQARDIADRLPSGEPGRMSMQITPRTLLCGSAFRVSGGVVDIGFDELQQLCIAAGDNASLAVGMAGMVMALTLHARLREASRLASELTEVLDSIGDPPLFIGLSFALTYAKHQAGEMAEMLKVAQRVIDLAGGEPEKGNLIIGSPLVGGFAWRGAARWCLGIPGWHDDFRQAVAIARALDPLSNAAATMYKYVLTIPNGVLLSDDTALRETAETLDIAERSADDAPLWLSRLARGIALVHSDDPQRQDGFKLLTDVREAALGGLFDMTAVPAVDIHLAMRTAATGDIDNAIDLIQSVIDALFLSGETIWIPLATTVLVESLLQRRDRGDVAAAQAAVDRLTDEAHDPGFALFELPTLRLHALLARAQSDEAAYRDYRDRYRDMARSLGFEGHMKWAEAMP